MANSSKDFDYKRINDPIHGQIGISKIERQIIETPEFQRLSRLYQLGLLYYIFPTATHTRFAHCIGTMHVISRMIDAINDRSKKDNSSVLINHKEKQKLRLAALLHDIGHYPLGHSTEWVFYRTEEEKSLSDFNEPSQGNINEEMPLDRMAGIQKNNSVSHEAFGSKILSSCTSITEIINREKYNTDEIISIATGENPTRWLYSQLIHSTLDADRIDYLLRDSYFAGISYGQIDLNFILSNLRYDNKEKLFAVDFKGITAFEHYILARYYMYLNMTYHKKVMAYELVAKSLYYEMSRQGKVIGIFEELIKKIKKDKNWLLSFDDSYFWNNLKNWQITGKNARYLRNLRDFLMKKKRPQMILEERRLVEFDKSADPEFKILRHEKITDSKKINFLCKKYKIRKNCLALIENRVTFEEMPPLTSHRKPGKSDDLKKLGRVFEDYNFKDLIDVEYSIIRHLSKYSHYIRRLVYYDIYDSNPNDQGFRDEFRK